jgi:hypothetical protein
MKHKKHCFYFHLFNVLIIGVSACNFSFAQSEKPSKLYDKYIKSSSTSSDKFNSRIEKSNKKYLKKYFRQENKTYRKLCKTNPVLADHLFSVSNDPLFYRQQAATNPELLQNKNAPKEYFPHYDTIQSSLEYMIINKDKFQGVDTLELSKANVVAEELDTNLSYSDKLQQYFRHRKMTMKESLSNYPELKSCVIGYDKVNYYYHEQIASCKKLFSDPVKVEAEAIKILKGNTAFKQFIAKNGMLSSFDKIPSSWGKSLNGLQTIPQTKVIIQKSITALGTYQKEIIGEKMKPMQETMCKLKSGNYGKVTNAADVPDFNPNPLKTKRFIDRIQFGTNFSVNQTNAFYPATINTGLQVGYNLTQKIIPGIGLSYVLGLGKNWNNTSLTHQGAGLRSFVDYKISSLLFIESGYEKNFKHEIKNLDQLKEKKYWQNSTLLGLKLKYKVGVSYGTIALLYDFLHEEHYPNSSALVYRIGWEFGK